MQRRSFFRTASPSVVWVDETPRTLGDAALIRFSRQAMATTFEVALPYGTPHAHAAAEEALDLIDSLEDQLTIYRDCSEVSQLNARATTEAVEVEAGLFSLLSHCAEITRDTSGGFDVATGSLIHAWGFSKRNGRVPTPVELKHARENSGMKHVALDGKTRSVKYLRRALSINLGSIGKGYALDRAAECLQSHGIRSALLHGGGSSIHAVGSPPDSPQGWPVAIQHPSNRKRKLATAMLKDQGMGTSAATFQFFVYNNRKYGHVIDPRTGSPAQGTRSASVIAPSAALADTLSTAFFVQGVDAARTFLTSRPELAAIILPDDADHATILTSDPRKP
jgi:FAD:protein FMN transferase